MSRLGTISLSTNGLILRFVGDTLVIETTDLDELRREVTRALGDEPLSVQEAARHLKLSVKTIRNRIKDGTLRGENGRWSGVLHSKAGPGTNPNRNLESG